MKQLLRFGGVLAGAVQLSACDGSNSSAQLIVGRTPAGSAGAAAAPIVDAARPPLHTPSPEESLDAGPSRGGSSGEPSDAAEPGACVDRDGCCLDETRDCAGVCGGSAERDCAGVCNGTAQLDCAGVCNGTAQLDCTGICAGAAQLDCMGACAGAAQLDCMGVCAGAAQLDCVGVCNGTAELDCAGVCNGSTQLDCMGVCGGTAELDCAGVCNGSAQLDCMGVCGGAAELDCAGACNGSAQRDCASVCNGSAEFDCAGVCNGSAEVDCAAVCNGSAEVDCAGVCNGSAQVDCAGACNGAAEVDCAGVCNGPGTLEGAFCCADGPCPAPTCWDGRRNGSESDVDCGGGCLPACAVGASCGSALDCAGFAVCVDGRCAFDAGAQPTVFRPQATIGDLAHDPESGRLYVSVGPGTGAYSNSIVAFETDEPSPAWHLPAAEPNALALTDDGSSLYVSVGFERVARVDTTTRTLGEAFPLGTDDFFGPMLAKDLAAVPGQPDTVAVVGGYWGSSALTGVHLYRQGVELFPGDSTDDWSLNAPLLDVSLIAFRDAQTFYTYSTTHTTGGSGYDLGIARITEQGIELERVQSKVVTGELNRLLYADGRLFSSWGQVVDTEDLTVLGTLGIGTDIQVSPDGSRYYVVYDLDAIGAGGVAVYCYDTASFVLTGGFVVPAGDTGGDLGFNPRLSRWGDTGLGITFNYLVSSTLQSNLLLIPRALELVEGCEPYATPEPQRPPLLGPVASSGDGRVQSLALDARSVVRDPDDGGVYIALGSSDPHYPNSVIRIAPGAASPTWATWVGSEPRLMDVTPGGGPLWVGFDGSTMVRSIDVHTGELASEFPIGISARYGASYPIDIAAIPGHPESVIVVGDYPNTTTRTSYYFYDSGVERYGLVNSPSHLLLLGNLDAGKFELQDASRLYGARDNRLVVVDVAPDGLTATETSILMGDDFRLGAQRLVTAEGLVVDPVHQATIGAIQFATDPAPGYPGSRQQFSLSPDGGTAYFAKAFARGVANRISCYDLTTLELKGMLRFDAPRPDGTTHGPILGAARWGDTGMALVVRGGVLLVRDGAPELAGCE